MNELLLQKVDALLREHVETRRELDLYRRLFDALISAEPAGAPTAPVLWAYHQTPEADRAVERVLRYRAELSASVGRAHCQQPI